MKKRLDRRFLVVSISTLIFLGLFGGFYQMIRARYGNFPEDSFYFEGGVPTIGQFLTMNFYDIELMLAYSVIALILGIVFQAIDDKLLNRYSWIMTSFVVSISVGLMYFAYKLLATGSFDDEHLDMHRIELREEMIFCIGMYFIFSLILTALLRLIAVPERHASQR